MVFLAEAMFHANRSFLPHSCTQVEIRVGGWFVSSVL
jgi:hypothetical protein